MGDLCNRKLTKEQLKEQEELEEEFESEPSESEEEEESSEEEEEEKDSDEGSDNEKVFSSSTHIEKADYGAAFKPKQGLTIEEFSKLKDASCNPP